MTVEGVRNTSLGFGRGTVSYDAAWSLGYSAVVRTATLAASIAIARLAGPAGSGALGVALQVTALGSTLAAFNLPQSLSRYLAASNEPAMQRRLLQTSACMILVASAITGFGIAILSGWLGRHVYRDPSLGRVLLWCGPLVVTTASMLWVEGALQGLRQFPTLTRWGALVSVLDLTFGVAAAFLGVVGLIASRALIRAGAVVVAVVRLFRAQHFDGPSKRGDFVTTARPLLSFAAPTLLSAGIVLAAQAALRLLLVRSAGIGAAGHYQAADSVAQGLTLLPAAASIALMRSVASREASGYAGLAASLRRGLERVVGWNIPICLALIGIVPWVLPVLFGAGFVPARPVLVLLATAYGLSGPCAVFGAIMLGRGEVWAGVVVNLVWSVVVLVTFGFGGTRFGAAGAAIALIAGYVVLFLLCLVLIVPRWAISIRTLLPVTFATFASLGVGCACALARTLPAPATGAVCFALGLAVFARWGWAARAERDQPTVPR
jgi:O-antigen/teichoic acid export membrane protein